MGNSFGGTVNDSRYVWLPLTFPTSTSMSMTWSPEVTLDTAAGTVSGTSATYNTLIARHSARCADITSQSLWQGAQIKQYDCNGGGNQKYWFKSVGSGYYQLVVRSSSLCVQENANTVSQENCSASSNAQQWSLTTSGSYVNVKSRASGECLDVNGASTANSAAVITYTCNGGTNQQWTRGT